MYVSEKALACCWLTEHLPWTDRLGISMGLGESKITSRAGQDVLVSLLCSFSGCGAGRAVLAGMLSQLCGGGEECWLSLPAVIRLQVGIAANML